MYINKIIYSQKRVSNNHRQFSSLQSPEKGRRLALKIYTDLHTSKSRKRGNENPSLQPFSDEMGINYRAVTLLLLHLELRNSPTVYPSHAGKMVCVCQ